MRSSGKRVRLGIDRPSYEASRVTSRVHSRRTPRPTHAPAHEPKLPTAPLPPERPRDPSVALVDLLDLTERHCRWPIGDPGTDGFGFCAAHRNPGEPYCGEHRRIAFEPLPKPRPRKVQPDAAKELVRSLKQWVA